uniref:Uncharacterized protein n=1 Tax=Trieres chinensis TaxID=1514140 RepID=A0A7S2E9P2_TRICV
MGVARIQLEALKYILDIHEYTPIVSNSGKSYGELEVAMIPSVIDCQTEVEDLEEEGVLGKHMEITTQVRSVRGLSFDAVQSFKSFFVRWRILSREWTKSVCFPLDSINPTIGYQSRVTAKVTRDLCKFFCSAALCIEVSHTTILVVFSTSSHNLTIIPLFFLPSYFCAGMGKR